MTVNKVCGSGLKAVALADAGHPRRRHRLRHRRRLREHEPHPVRAAGRARRPAPRRRQVTDLLVHDGLWDVYNNFHMGMTAEWVVDTYKVSREDQDAFAAESHRRAVAAWAAGKFAREVVPVSIAQKKGDPVVCVEGRGAARRRDGRVPGEAQARLQARRRHRDRGQRLDDQRRRRGAADLRARSSREEARPEGARAIEGATPPAPWNRTRS
jgi:hypothetical protein